MQGGQSLCKQPAESLPGFAVLAHPLPSCEKQFSHFCRLPDLLWQSSPRGGGGAKTGGGWPFPYSFLSPRSCGFLGQPHRRVLFRCLNPTRRYLRGLFLEEVLNRERERGRDGEGGGRGRGEGERGREYEWFIKKPVLLKLQYA